MWQKTEREAKEGRERRVKNKEERLYKKNARKANREERKKWREGRAGRDKELEALEALAEVDRNMEDKLRPESIKNYDVPDEFSTPRAKRHGEPMVLIEPEKQPVREVGDEVVHKRPHIPSNRPETQAKERNQTEADEKTKIDYIKQMQ